MNMLCDNLFDCAVFRNYGRSPLRKEYEPVQFKLELAYKDLRLAGAKRRICRNADVVCRLAP